MKTPKIEKPCSPENLNLKKYETLGREISSAFEGCILLYTEKDYPRPDPDFFDMEDWRIHREEIAEIERIKREVSVLEVFPIVKKFMKDIEELDSMKIGEIFVQGLINRSHNETDLIEIDVNIGASDVLERIAEEIKITTETFVKVRGVMKEYEETHVVKKSAGIAEEYENTLKNIFIAYKKSAENIGELVRLSVQLLK